MGFTEASLDAMRYEVEQEFRNVITDEFKTMLVEKLSESLQPIILEAIEWHRSMAILEREMKLIHSVGQDIATKIKNGMSLDDLMKRYLISEENRQFLEAELSKYA